MKKLLFVWVYLITTVSTLPCGIDIQKEGGFSEYGPPNGHLIATTTQFNNPDDCHQECCNLVSSGCSASWFIRVPDGSGGLSPVCQLWQCDPCTTISYKQPKYDSEVGIVDKFEPQLPPFLLEGDTNRNNNATQQTQDFGEQVPDQFPSEQGSVIPNSNDMPYQQFPQDINGIPPYQQNPNDLPTYPEESQQDTYQNPPSSYQNMGSSPYQNMESFPQTGDSEQNSRPEYNPEAGNIPFGNVNPEYIIPNSESQQSQPVENSNMLPQASSSQRGHWVYNSATGEYVFVNEGTQLEGIQPDNLPSNSEIIPGDYAQSQDDSWLLDSIQGARTENTSEQTNTSETFTDTTVQNSTTDANTNISSSTWWEGNSTTTVTPTSADSGWFNFWPFGSDKDNDEEDWEEEWEEEEEEEEELWEEEMQQFKEEQEEYTTPEHDSSTEEMSTQSSKEMSDESSNDSFEYDDQNDQDNDDQWNFGDTNDQEQEEADDNWLQNLADQDKEQTRPSVLENQYTQDRPGSVGQSQFDDQSFSTTSYINAPVIAVGACVAVVVVLLLLVFLGKRLTGKTERAQYKPLRESFSGSSTYHEDI